MSAELALEKVRAAAGRLPAEERSPQLDALLQHFEGLEKAEAMLLEAERLMGPPPPLGWGWEPAPHEGLLVKARLRRLGSLAIC